MRVTVLLFGACREATGTPEWSGELEAQHNVTVKDAVSAVVRQFPKLEALTRTALFALNEEHVTVEHVVHEGDTVAIFPPVSGGEGASRRDAGS